MFIAAPSQDCIMVVPAEPFLLRGEDAIKAVEQTPRWSEVEISKLQVDLAQEGRSSSNTADARR